MLLAQGSIPSLLVQNIHAQFQQQSSKSTVFVMPGVSPPVWPVWPKSAALIALPVTHAPFFLLQIPLGFFRDHGCSSLDLVDPFPTGLDEPLGLETFVGSATDPLQLVYAERFRVGEHPLALSAPSYLCRALHLLTPSPAYAGT